MCIRDSGSAAGVDHSTPAAPVMLSCRTGQLRVKSVADLGGGGLGGSGGRSGRLASARGSGPGRTFRRGGALLGGGDGVIDRGLGGGSGLAPAATGRLDATLNGRGN